MDWIDHVADIVKTASDAPQGWTRLLQFCKTERPSEMWNALPAVDVSSDVRSATHWLNSELGSPQAPKPMRGVSLGLDTLNMSAGDGYNVEIGATAECDPLDDDCTWISNCEWYGEQHLIQGIAHLKSAYDQDRWQDLYAFADYALFLGYGGLVLGDALSSLEGREPLLAVWGFFDGDLFRLGRRTTAGFERLCTVL